MKMLHSPSGRAGHGVLPRKFLPSLKRCGTVRCKVRALATQQKRDLPSGDDNDAARKPSKTSWDRLKRAARTRKSSIGVHDLFVRPG